MAFKKVGNAKRGNVQPAGHKGKPFAPAPRAPIVPPAAGQPVRIAAHKIHVGQPQVKAPKRDGGGRGTDRPT